MRALFAVTVLFLSLCSAEWKLVWSIAETNSNCNETDLCQFFVHREASDPRIAAVEVVDFRANGNVTRSIGGDKAPSFEIVQLAPNVLCDSYVGLGWVVQPENKTGCTDVDPDFVLNETHFSGGWFCSNPLATEQLDETEFFVAQLGVNQGNAVGLNLRVLEYTPGSTAVRFTYLTEICGRDARVNPPFTMPDLPMTSVGPSTGTTLVTASTAETTGTTAQTTTGETTSGETTTAQTTMNPPTTTAAPATLPSSDPTTTAEPTDSGSATAAIVILVVAVIIVIGVLILAYIRYKRNRARQMANPSSGTGGGGGDLNDVEMMGDGDDPFDDDAVQDFL